MSGRFDLPDIVHLQGVIVFIVFRKIQRLCFGGDTLAGIVFEFSACVIDGTDALLDTKDLLVIQPSAVDAVCTGTLNFLTKQHGHDLF